jgi:glycosyltransferase involved in cell wall biosynthesis
MIRKSQTPHSTMRLAVLTSHPIQYYAPLFRELARQLELHVFFAHRVTPAQQAEAGFNNAFDWDVDLTSGYAHSYLRNVADKPSAAHFAGCDTPDIGSDLQRLGRVDGLLTFGWYLKSFLQGLWAAKRMRIPILVRGDSHLDTPRSSLKRKAKEIAYPLFLRRYDAALYVGARSRAYYEHYRYPAERLFFSPHCVDTEWFSSRATTEAGLALRERLGIGAQENVVLFAGKLVPFKRPLDAVDACAALARDGMPVHLVVAGSGELESAMRERAAAMGTSIHMLGFQNQTAMPAAYAAANVLVLPSDGRESWGLVSNEAQACGVPVVVSDACGCAPDLAADGVAGKSYPLGDVGAVADAIGTTLTRPPERHKLDKLSRAYSVKAAGGGIVEALGWLAGNAGSSARHHRGTAC